MQVFQHNLVIKSKPSNAEKQRNNVQRIASLLSLKEVGLVYIVFNVRQNSKAIYIKAAQPYRRSTIQVLIGPAIDQLLRSNYYTGSSFHCNERQYYDMDHQEGK